MGTQVLTVKSNISYKLMNTRGKRNKSDNGGYRDNLLDLSLRLGTEGQLWSQVNIFNLRSKLLPKLTTHNLYESPRPLLWTALWTRVSSVVVLVSVTLKAPTSAAKYIPCPAILPTSYFGWYQHYLEDKKEEKMRMRNKYRKPTTLRCNAGSRCSFSVVVWSLVGCLLLLHLSSNFNHKDGEGRGVQLRITHHPQFRELQEVEEENIQIPPPRGKRSPRAAKRRPKRTTTLIDEFLDENSQLRHIFFPGRKRAIDPLKNVGNDSYYYYPGRIWLDTDGNPIQAHGGGILYDKYSRTYYWYGEYKEGPTYHAHKKGPARVDIIGVGCYSSKDLWTWKNEGIVLPAQETNETHDLHKSNVLERPKVIYNDKTGKYVMWMHIDDANYTKAAVGVAVSDTPDGPFDYLGSQRPHGYESRDMTIFKDDDGVAYMVYSSEDNSELHIGPLTEDYFNVASVMKRVLVGQHREAPALLKHQGTYYMITSGCTGWAPNEALVHAAESILGTWETMGNPCMGGNQMFRLTTFFSQSTFVLPLPGFPGSFIFMADRWNPADLRDSRYVWLPLIVAGPADQPLEYTFEFPLWSRVSIYWHRKWKLPKEWAGFK